MSRTKKIILKIIIVLLLLGMALFLNGQELAGNRKIHQDFGTWSMDVGEDKVAIKAYCTVESLMKYPTNGYEKQSLAPYEVHRFELFLVSKSVYQRDSTSTWIYGGRVYINNVEMTADQFPDGFILSIGTEPTLVYWYETIPIDGLSIYISWDKAVYETRIRK